MMFNIRPMRDSDIEQVFLIETHVHIAPWSKEILKDCVLVGYDCRVFELIDDAGRNLVGYIIMRQIDKSVHILNFCIAKIYQSRGYGRRFLQAVLDSFSKIEFIVLEVRPSNKVAMHLYESLGFQQVEIKKDYYKDGVNREDAILLQKNFS